ncbi:hypothetical protein JTE90_016594 [Oedothorax gibbosus]|uniref:Fibrinogen C-terminal domain-containing protein n=1 Tax=Oedothorax gibbosus TaxID=931172 RepID=A0AAV6UCU3_9ARAC|nr:hypothetical protein JTE90_016594 [Oedothorax gibbosus]
MNERRADFIILFMLLYVTANAQEKQTLDCGAKITTQSYLEVAGEMIKKAKDTNSNCPSQSAVTIDCETLLKSGNTKSKVYTVWPKSRVLDGKPVEVYCDMETDGGGWTVIQRRGNYLGAKDHFFQDWEAYKNGFGNVEEDFWLGNDNIFALTNQRLYSLRIDLRDVEGNKTYAAYDSFWIDDDNHKYTLHVRGYSGDAGDSLIASHNNQKFSTKDQDHDTDADTNCAQSYKGGWWYSACHTSNLNGLYPRGKHESFADGVVWLSWKGYHESMDTVEIKIRPKNFRKTVQTVDLDVTPQ